MALLPPAFLKSVVSIERETETGIFKCIGTGFLFFKTYEHKGGNQYTGQGYIVTAKHVLFHDGRPQDEQIQEISICFDAVNETDNGKFHLKLYDDNKMARFSIPLNSNADVAVIPAPATMIAEYKLDNTWIVDSKMTLLKDRYMESGVSTGDFVFVLGFPFGMRGVAKNYTICRSGTIARLDEECLRDNEIFLDAPIFPGNSGGPVFCRPEINKINGTCSVSKAYLLGMATKYLSRGEAYDVSLSEKDIQLLEGHLGLSKIVTVDAIHEAIHEHEVRTGKIKERD